MTTDLRDVRQAGKIIQFEEDTVGFGPLPESINALLQRGVVAYRSGREEAERLFAQALIEDPAQLPAYYCLYKIYTYQGRLDEAESAAEAGLKEAARQAGWEPDIESWSVPEGPLEGPARFALYTLKALAFINLKKGSQEKARRYLARLSELDPDGQTGWTVIQALAEGL